MESASETLPAYLPTLTSSYRNVERYYELMATAVRGFNPPVNLSALDAFLLQQAIRYLPEPATVIDMATQATAGSSVICWLSAERIRRVVAPKSDWATTESSDWRTGFGLAAEAMDVDTAVLSDHSVEQVLKEHFTPLSPVVFSLAQTETDAALLGQRLKSLLEIHPQATIFLLPLGDVGDSALLTEALNFVNAHAEYKLQLVRELCPFWASSRLGVIFPSANADVPASLYRLRQQYDGNFEFLNLARLLTQSELRAQQELERERQAYVALQSSFSLKYELKRWLWQRFPTPIKRLIRKLRGLPVENVV